MGQQDSRADPQHRTIICADIEGSSDPQRTDQDRVAVRDALYRVVGEAFELCGLSWADCRSEDRGDGFLALVGPDVSKRTAAMIGGDLARKKIAQFTAIDQARVIDELLRAWRQSDDPQEYAQTILAEIDFGDRPLEIRSWHRAQHLRYLTRLSRVVCRGDLTPLDPLAAIPRLQRLSLMSNDVLRDLSPLARCRSLMVLELAVCPLVRDLSALAGTTVEELSLHLMRADLGTLAGTGIRRLAVRDHALAGGMQALPDDLPLRELTMDNRPADRNLAGIDRWPGLERVCVSGIPRPDEVRALAGLPELRHLIIRRPESGDGLLHLEPLESLGTLELTEVASADQQGIRAVARLCLPNAEIRVAGRGAARIG